MPKGDRDSIISLPGLDPRFQQLNSKKLKQYDKRVDPWAAPQTNFNQNNNNDIDVMNTETDPYPGNFWFFLVWKSFEYIL